MKELKLLRVEVFDDTPNRTVLRMPGRSYPGILVQGDTLDGLLAAAEAAARGELMGGHQLLRRLKDLSDHYEKVCRVGGADHASE